MAAVSTSKEGAPAPEAAALNFESLANRQYLVRIAVPAGATDSPVAYVDLPERTGDHPAIGLTVTGRAASAAGLYVDSTEVLRERDEDGHPAERDKWLRVHLGVLTAPAEDTQVSAVLAVLG